MKLNKIGIFVSYFVIISIFIIQGGRSFSIWDAETMERVFDSGSDFEKVTAQKYPDYFNCSNDSLELEDRSGKKGPEPESVEVGQIGDQIYVFVAIERIGGVMVYNITDINHAKYVDYINTRDFSEDISGDVSPEGLSFISKENSPTGKELLLVANEVSGTVAVYQWKIDELAKRNIMTGVGKDKLALNSNVTRTEFLAMLAQEANMDVSKYQTNKQIC